jgi:flagellin
MIEKIRPQASLAVDRSTKRVNDAIERVTDRLAGKPSNPADIGVASRLSAQYRENYLNARNAQDAISYMQTRDGYLSGIGDSLHRLRDLAVSLGNPILNSSDKKIIMDEANMIMKDIDSTASSAEFNGHKLVQDAGLGTLGLNGFNFGSEGSIDRIDGALNTLNSKRAETGAAVSTLEARIDNMRMTNENLAEAYNNVVDSDPLEDIIELNQSINEALTAIKTQDLITKLETKSVLSLLDFK